MSYLNKTTPLAWLAGMGLAAAGLFAADAATAQVAIPTGASVFLPCLSKTADATKVMGPGVNSVNSMSNGGAYGTGTNACKAWVVDISVPHNSSGAAGWGNAVVFSGTGPIWTATTKTACEGTVVTEELYRKGGTQTAFTRVAGGHLKGVWTAGDMFPCMLVAQTGYVPFPMVSPPHVGPLV